MGRGLTSSEDCHGEMVKRLYILFMLMLYMGCASMPEKPAVPAGTVFYPPPPQRPRLQFLQSISGDYDLGKKQSAFQTFIVGNPRYQLLGEPYDVAASKGKIYILDRMYKTIVTLDLASQEMSFLNDHGIGKLGDPSGIWVSEEGLKYVADMQRKQVVTFDQDDNFLRTYGGPDIFEKPVDVAVYGQRLYVVDLAKEQLFILDSDTGGVIKTVGQKGEFFKPSHLTVGPAGNVFVTDALHFVIKKFSPEGQFLDTIGFHGDQIGGFARPKGVAVDKDGRLYVVDAAFENVQIFDDQGRILLFFGGPGDGRGDLYLPAGIAVDKDNTAYFQKFADPGFKLEYLVYVTNMFGKNMLNVYGFGQWTGESLPGG
jgi:DNA-binding beta-propeller fold protein YncE